MDVRRILAQNPDVIDSKEQRRILRQNYPYDERRGYAYQQWLAAVREIVGSGKSQVSVRDMWIKGEDDGE